MPTKISWTNETWNPVTGCSKISPGCAHCYAEALSLRYGWSEQPWLPQHAKQNVVLHPDRLDQPLRWRQPRMVFVCSMADLFHERVPDEFILAVFVRMARCPQHTFQVLTKRPERMVDWFGVPRESMTGFWSARGGWPLPNVWLGVSVEGQRQAEERIPLLVRVPAVVRFVSAEPLLGPVDLREWLHPDWPTRLFVHWLMTGHEPVGWGDNSGRRCRECHFRAYADDVVPLHWVIVGGESGPQHRPMALDWVRTIRDLCVLAGVPFFYTQASHRFPGRDRILDGRTWDEMPEVRSYATQ